MFDDGYLKLTGRVKDMFIVGGTNAYPAEIEAFLSAHPKVKMVQVVGVPEHRLGEVGAAFIELKEGSQATEEEIVSFCRTRMANYKVPRYVIFLAQNEWPLTPSGKVQKYMLRKMFVAKTAR
jgi:fatty-acyl-CoA synthase